MALRAERTVYTRYEVDEVHAQVWPGSPMRYAVHGKARYYIHVQVVADILESVSAEDDRYTKFGYA
eukprot:COSAG02_NODE_3203_length_7181_cov_2.764897_3_plen_66_part_00